MLAKTGSEKVAFKAQAPSEFTSPRAIMSHQRALQLAMVTFMPLILRNRPRASFLCSLEYWDSLMHRGRWAQF